MVVGNLGNFWIGFWENLVKEFKKFFLQSSISNAKLSIKIWQKSDSWDLTSAQFKLQLCSIPSAKPRSSAPLAPSGPRWLRTSPWTRRNQVHWKKIYLKVANVKKVLLSECIEIRCTGHFRSLSYWFIGMNLREDLQKGAPLDLIANKCQMVLIQIHWWKTPHDIIY